MQKEIENLEVVEGVNFEFWDSLKNNGRKKLVNLWKFIWIELQYKTVFWYCWKTSWIEYYLIYNNINLFHQSKLGRDVELQNTHILLYESARHVMQVSRLSGQLRIESELVDCYWDATSALYGRLLNNMSPRPDKRLHYTLLYKTLDPLLQCFLSQTGWSNQTCKLWTYKISTL